MRVGLVLLLLLSCSVQAVEVGERLAPWTLLDQFDEPFTLNDETRVLLVARSMATAQLVDQALAQRPKGYLEQRHAAYVADIERMPAVARMFAIPSMRSASYRILLDRNGRVAPRYEGDRETVQWLEIKGGVLQNKQTFTDAQRLRAALEAL